MEACKNLLLGMLYTQSLLCCRTQYLGTPEMQLSDENYGAQVLLHNKIERHISINICFGSQSPSNKKRKKNQTVQSQPVYLIFPLIHLGLNHHRRRPINPPSRSKPFPLLEQGLAALVEIARLPLLNAHEPVPERAGDSRVQRVMPERFAAEKRAHFDSELPPADSHACGSSVSQSPRRWVQGRKKYRMRPSQGFWTFLFEEGSGEEGSNWLCAGVELR